MKTLLPRLVSLIFLFAALCVSAEEIREGVFIFELDSYNCKLVGVDRSKGLPETLAVPAQVGGHSVSILAKECLAELDGVKKIIVNGGERWLTVSNRAMAHCPDLVTVDFPEKLDVVYGDILDGCENLQQVICRNEAVPDVQDCSTAKTNFNNVTLYVPETSISRYRTQSDRYNANFWGEFGSYLSLDEYEENPQETPGDKDDDGDNPGRDDDSGDDDGKEDNPGSNDENGDDGGDDNNDGDDDTGGDVVPPVVSASELLVEADMIDYTLSGQNLTIKNFKNKEYKGKILVPPTIDIEGVAYKVNTLGTHCFEGCAGITEIRALATADVNYYVYSDAFTGCSNLRRVEFPATLYDLELGAFKDCGRLKTVFTRTDKDLLLMDNDIEGVSLEKVALHVNPAVYEDFLKENKNTAKLFGRVLTTDDEENVIFSMGNYRVEFLHMMPGHSMEFGGCSVLNHNGELFGLESNMITIAAAGGFVIEAAENPSTVPSAASSRSITLGKASLSLADVEEGHQFVISLPIGLKAVGMGCEITDGEDNTYLVTVTSPDVFKVTTAAGMDSTDVIRGTDISVSCRDGLLTIFGLEEGENVRIMDMTGRYVYVGQENQIALPRGHYIVVTHRGAVKVYNR